MMRIDLLRGDARAARNREQAIAKREGIARWAKSHPDRRRAAQARYRSKPGSKEKRAALDRARKERQDPSYIRAKKTHWLSDKGKAQVRAWRKSAAGIAWKKSDKRVSWEKAYAKSEKERERVRLKARAPQHKASNQRYMQTEAGKLMNQRRSHRRRAALRGVPSEFTKEQWGALQRAYDCCCAYCGAKKSMTQDHVRAVKNGGHDRIENIVPACKSCNSRKRDLEIPVAFKMFGVDTDAFWARHEAAVAKVRGEIT